jgi:beta-glucanase (GH16 family)
VSSAVSATNVRRLLAVLISAVVVAGLFVPAGPLGASSALSCGTPALRKADGSLWRCTFDDEFSGTVLNRSAWTVQTTANGGFQAGTACALDSANTVAVARGSLNLTARRTAPFVCASSRRNFTTSYQGGSVYTRAFSQQYGRFDVRARFADSNGHPGVQGALWLYPRTMTATGLLSTGEIDMAEAYGQRPDHVIPTVHAAVSLFGGSKACVVPDYGASFHTYTTIWTPTSVTFVYDGNTCLRVSTPTGSLSSPTMVALTQGTGSRRNVPTASTPLPATLQVDYVRVWA